MTTTTNTANNINIIKASIMSKVYKLITDKIINQLEAGTIDNSAAYIKSWLKALKNDDKLLIQAASKAQKAANYIRDIQQ